MGARIIAVLGIYVALSVAGCGGGDDTIDTTDTTGTTETTETTAATSTTGATGTTRTTRGNGNPNPPDTNPTVPPKFDVSATAARSGNQVTVTLSNTGDLTLVSGQMTIELPGAHSVGGDCELSGDQATCDLSSFMPRQTETVVIQLESSDDSGATTTAGSLVARVVVTGQLPGGEVAGKTLSVPVR